VAELVWLVRQAQGKMTSLFICRPGAAGGIRIAQLGILVQRKIVKSHLCTGVVVLFLSLTPAFPADFSVTSPGYYYSINGAGPNPALTVERGKTYTFSINTFSVRPFQIRSTGVINNNISSGTITWTVPAAASNYTS